MIDASVLEHIRHGSIGDALAAANEAKKNADVFDMARVGEAEKRVDAIDMRTLVIVGFCAIQGGLDMLFGILIHGR